MKQRDHKPQREQHNGHACGEAHAAQQAGDEVRVVVGLACFHALRPQPYADAYRALMAQATPTATTSTVAKLIISSSIMKAPPYAACGATEDALTLTSPLSFTFAEFTGLRCDSRTMMKAASTASTPTAMVPHRPVFANAHASAPTTPAAGKVTSHATSMRPATFQLTWPPFLPRPDPMMEPEHTCVVDSAKPDATTRG